MKLYFNYRDEHNAEAETENGRLLGWIHRTAEGSWQATVRCESEQDAIAAIEKATERDF